MRRLAIVLIAVPMLACAFGPQVREMMLAIASRRDDVGIEGFRVTFLTGTTPTNIVLGASYAGPGDPSLALYDSGDGVWHEYTSKTIAVVGDYVAFKGDWRTSGGIYRSMFQSTFESTAYTCKFQGALEHTPSTFTECYREIFRDCTAVISIEDNPLPILTGAPAESMFFAACSGMSGVEGALPTGFLDTSGLTGAPATSMFNNACRDMTKVTSLPTGFMDTSGLTGAPAVNMFYFACFGMSGVEGALPTGFMDTSGLTGAPARNMFNSACRNMSGVEGALPAGFMDTSGLSGAPATSMFASACYNMSGVTNAYTFSMSSNITWTAENVVGPLNSAFRNMPGWGGEVMWGTNVLVEAIPVPDSRIYTFEGSTNMPNYEIIDTNWK